MRGIVLDYEEVRQLLNTGNLTKNNFYTQEYKSGDILYAMESWSFGYMTAANADKDKVGGYFYQADLEPQDLEEFAVEWRPAVSMPEAAARIWMQVMHVDGGTVVLKLY